MVRLIVQGLKNYHGGVKVSTWVWNLGRRVVFVTPGHVKTGEIKINANDNYALAA